MSLFLLSPSAVSQIARNGVYINMSFRNKCVLVALGLYYIVLDLCVVVLEHGDTYCSLSVEILSMILVSVGCLNWCPSLRLWKVVSRLVNV